MGEYNVVFEGGGVKGIGLVGAAHSINDAGHSFCGLAGTSAGAIVAALIAADFTPEEMKNILFNTNYLKFKQKSCWDYLGFIGVTAQLLINYGIYSSDYFNNWLSKILAKKQIKVFGDIKNKPGCRQKYKFQAIASDITARRLLILPDDLARFGVDIDKFSISRAVTMSMSIPLFFEPVVLKDKYLKPHIIVDGGLLSNYPLWLFDDDDKKTLSLRFKENSILHAKKDPTHDNFIVFLKNIMDTMLEAHDKQHIKFREGDLARTVFIDTEIIVNGKKQHIKSTQFDIDKNETAALYENGVKAGNAFVNRVRLREREFI